MQPTSDPREQWLRAFPGAMTDSRMPGRNGAVVVEAAPEAMGFSALRRILFVAFMFYVLS